MQRSLSYNTSKTNFYIFTLGLNKSRMKINKNYCLKGIFLILVFFNIARANSQVNAGFITGYDLYQRWVNPDDGTGYDRSAGSVILNSSLGGKIWLGGQKASLSLEGYANLGFLSLNVEEYYGLGSLSVPFVGKINFKGLSGFSPLKKLGYSFGGGVQFNKTELFGLNNKAKERGIERPYFMTYVIELGIGNGTKSKMTEFFFRFGLNPNLPSNSLSIGVNTSYSIPHMKKPKFNMTPDLPEEEIIKM